VGTAKGGPASGGNGIHLKKRKKGGGRPEFGKKKGSLGNKKWKGEVRSTPEKTQSLLKKQSSKFQTRDPATQSRGGEIGKSRSKKKPRKTR